MEENKKISQSTKICITVIILLLIGMCIGGYFLYNYAYDEGKLVYAGDYDNGYNEGFSDGYKKGYNTAQDLNKTSQMEQNNDTGYLTTDTAPKGTVWMTPSGEKYHKGWCRYIDGRNDLSYCYSAEEAESYGYTPCSVCY